MEHVLLSVSTHVALDCLDEGILIDEKIYKKKKKKKNRSFLIHRSLDTIDGSPYDRLVK